MSLSVVIPVYNDDESLAYLHQAFYDALGDQPYDWEIILVMMAVPMVVSKS